MGALGEPGWLGRSRSIEDGRIGSIVTSDRGVEPVSGDPVELFRVVAEDQCGAIGLLPGHTSYCSELAISADTEGR